MKPWWQSRTIWLNAATALIAVSVSVPDVIVAFGISAEIAAEVRVWALVANVTGNTVLRFLTTQAIGKAE